MLRGLWSETKVVGRRKAYSVFGRGTTERVTHPKEGEDTRSQ